MADLTEIVQALMGKNQTFNERFGAVTPYLQPPARTDYPSQDDVDFARKYDMTYGRPSAGIDTPGQRVGVIPTMQDVKNAGNYDQWNLQRKPMTQFDRDREYAAWLATNRSPVASLGYDPANTYTTPVNDKTTRLTVGGFFDPKSQRLWYDQRDPDSQVHEATHKGISILRALHDPAVPDKTPKFLPEEYYVRALMNRHFGDIEMGKGNAGDSQVRIGKELAKNNPNALNALEAAAAREINRRHPMGPN